MKIVDFLDVTFNLDDGTYKPFMKPNDSPLYININSILLSHLQILTPKSVNRRLSKISSNEQIFKDSVSSIQDALDKAGFSHTLLGGDF